MAHEETGRRPRRPGGRRWTAARPSAGAGRTRAPTYARSPQRGSRSSAKRAGRECLARRCLELVAGDRRAARTPGSRAARAGRRAVPARRRGRGRRATLARAVATRDDLLAQILGWAEPAYTGDAMARHAGRSAEAVNALLEYPQALESQQQLGPARTAQPPTGASSTTFTT
jgi:hypothetical protein